MSDAENYSNSRERLSALVSSAEDDDYVDRNGKCMPYLGWFWRDISEHGVTISWHDGQLWLNEPRKWDYPGVHIDDDVDALCDDLGDIVKQVIEQGGILDEHEQAYQEVLYEYSGDIPVYWNRCDMTEDCDYETKYTTEFDEEYYNACSEGESMKSHIKDEHPDELIDSLDEFGGDLDNVLVRRSQHYERFVHHRIDADPEGQ